MIDAAVAALFRQAEELESAGDWPGAAAKLCNEALWAGYQTRRAAEGKLLKRIKPVEDRKK